MGSEYFAVFLIPTVVLFRDLIEFFFSSFSNNRTLVRYKRLIKTSTNKTSV